MLLYLFLEEGYGQTTFTYNHTMLKPVLEIKYRDLYDNLPCGCITVNPEGTVVGVNKAFSKITGYQRDEVVEKMKFKDFLTSGGNLFLESQIKPRLHLYGQAEEIKIEILNKENKKIPALLNSVQERDHTGADLYTQHAIVDISQRNLYEKELLHAKRNAEELSQKLAKTNNELNQFASTVAHDIQSPLNNVIGLVNMIKKTYSSNMDRTAFQFINYIEKSSEKMRQQIVDLLKLSLNGRSIEDMELVNLNNTLDLAKSNLYNLINQNNATIKVPQPLPNLLGFAPDILSLFQNLILNAIQYRKPNVDPIIEIFWTEEEKHFLFHIKDNGIGIDKQYHTQIFKEYFTLTGKKGERVGLGLSKSKTIVENHKGSIEVFSVPAEGCTISFKLEK